MMPLEKSPYWTDLYYDIIENYFWSPQSIGRKTTKSGQPWSYWKEKLQSQEVPLNHMLDLFFHVVPQELLDLSVSALLGKGMSAMEVVVSTPGTLDGHVVQPDITFRNEDSLVFVEMKVDSKSSVDQFTKYAIAALILTREQPELLSVDLVILSRHLEHQRIWQCASQLSLCDENAVRSAALRGLNDDPSIWKEKGVQSFLESHPEDLVPLSEQIGSMGLQLADYNAFARVLKEYAATERTVDRLISGVLNEFEVRELVDSSL
jgi:hypothetical protein